MRALPFLLVAGLAGCGAWSPEQMRDIDSVMNVVYMLALLAFLLFGVRTGGSGKVFLRNLALFLALLFGLVLAYSYRGEFKSAYSRVKSELLPGSPVSEGEGVVRLTRGMDGHFSTLALVNGRPTSFLIDTGATGVVLPFQEAIRLGFGSGNLVFTQPVQTANGMAFAAPIMIDEIEVEGIVIQNVTGSVTEPGQLSKPLLGMSFLNRLSRYSFEGGTMTMMQ